MPPSNTSYYPLQLESKRIQASNRLRYRLPEGAEDQHAFLLNLSMSGFFVRTQTPPTAGTRFEFELQLSRDEPKAMGEAEVVWVRHRNEGQDRPQGFGARILRLDPRGRPALQRLVETALNAIGEISEADELRSIVGEALSPIDEELEEVASQPPSDLQRRTEAPNSRADRSKRGQGWGVLAVAVALAFLGLAGLLLTGPEREAEPAGDRNLAEGQESAANATTASTADAPGLGEADPASTGTDSEESSVAATDELDQPNTQLADSGDTGSSSSEPTPGAEAAGPGSTTAGDTAAQEGDPTPSAAAATASTPPVPAQPRPQPALAPVAVEAWAQAWSAQDVDGYLRAYASTFQPREGRRRWETERRRKLSTPAFIRVQLAELTTESLADTRVRVTFLQDYASNSWADTVRKSLVLVWEEERWKIVEESVLETLRSGPVQG